MADFIDKSRLLTDYQQDLCGHIPCHECPFLVSNGHDSTECSLERYISEQPTVEVVLDFQAQTPKHGTWTDANWRQVSAYCSECGHLRLGNGAEYCNKYVHYCENCGARMGDGE